MLLADTSLLSCQTVLPRYFPCNPVIPFRYLNQSAQKYPPAPFPKRFVQSGTALCLLQNESIRPMFPAATAYTFYAVLLLNFYGFLLNQARKTWRTQMLQMSFYRCRLAHTDTPTVLPGRNDTHSARQNFPHNTPESSSSSPFRRNREPNLFQFCDSAAFTHASISCFISSVSSLSMIYFSRYASNPLSSRTLAVSSLSRTR